MTSPTLPAVATQVPVITRTPDAVDLFMFSASAWLLHRIHYDGPFTSEHEGHPALLIHGPLQGVYMTQSVERWQGSRIARLRSISYRHLAPAYLGDSLECGGEVVEADQAAGTIEVDLWVRRSDGTMTTTGRAIFEMRPR
ncbi:MAG: hotdog domain-containing protein [Acidimicrobiia bacterium]